MYFSRDDINSLLDGVSSGRRDTEIEEALAERYAEWERPDGSIVGRASVWLVGAVNPGG